MKLANESHLTYCTNIHPGETWEEVFASLQTYLVPLKKRLSPNGPMGVGLRLSNQASLKLIQEKELMAFKNWLDQNGLYVFTMNGFPYGGFHHQVVKDHVHEPDWTTVQRLEYTIRLCHILSTLLPDGMEGGISTSPVSYKPWFDKNPKALAEASRIGALNLTKVVETLLAIKLETGKTIHIDIEPEPDGLIDHTQDTIDFFLHQLIPTGVGHLMNKLSVSQQKAEEAIRTHLQICYDVCHFAVMYERPKEVINSFKAAGIKIGKIQISAALKAMLPEAVEERAALASRFGVFAESTYLHQVVARHIDHSHTQYPDLPQALTHIQDQQAIEWRTHFHVPIFIKDYQALHSTQEDIVEVLHLQNKQPFTQHLEIETYTWEVLPDSIKLDLLASIGREMEWVLDVVNKE